MPDGLRRLKAALATRPRPRPRILQFGGGNFLRGFFDWKIDRMNEAAGTDWGIVILRSIGSTESSELNAQDGLYTVLSRGLDGRGEAVSQVRMVHSVLGELSCQTEWDKVVALARSPDISVVVSNTTDAGIIHDASAKFGDEPAASFPAKVAQLLHARWKANGDGLQFIACELSDRAGDELRRIVLLHAAEWRLEDGFIDWVKSKNSFHNTLVDRIVSGFPKGEAEQVWKNFGYEDRCLTTAELYHSLIVEVRSDQMPMRIPLDEWDGGTDITDDVTPYKLRKVAILNGAHTALCPLAILSGIETVGDAMENRRSSEWLRDLLETEIKPFVPLPKAELDTFADAVLVRFANPYIRHAWRDISLSGLAKFKARNLDRMLAYLDKFGAAPPLLTLSLAAWLRLYAGCESLEPQARDAEPVLQWGRKLRTIEIAAEGGKEAMVSAFLSAEQIWGRSLDLPVLRQAMLEKLAKVDSHGMFGPQ